MKVFLLVIYTVFALLFLPATTFAAGPSDQYFKAQVVEIISQGEIIDDGHKNLFQDIKVKFENEKTAEIHLGDSQTLTADQKVAVGDKLIVIKTVDPRGKTTFSIYDKYRFDNVLLVLALFIVLVVGIAGLKGVGSLIGLATSLAVILFFIVPQILNGADPLVISLVGSVVILFVSTYVAHGVSRQTTVALISTFISLLITALVAVIFTNFGKLTGLGNEDVAALQIGATSIINLKGLFLAGVIIGTLGALNDMTITQAATVFELGKIEKNTKLFTLFKKGFSVGKEHILSLVNTLVLAYAGSALFIFIFIVLNPSKIPYWVILNTETISGEIISTVAGSSGLILAVPIATLLAAWVVLNYKNRV